METIRIFVMYVYFSRDMVISLWIILQYHLKNTQGMAILLT